MIVAFFAKDEIKCVLLFTDRVLSEIATSCSNGKPCHHTAGISITSTNVTSARRHQAAAIATKVVHDTSPMVSAMTSCHIYCLLAAAAALAATFAGTRFYCYVDRLQHVVAVAAGTTPAAVSGPATSKSQIANSWGKRSSALKLLWLVF